MVSCTLNVPWPRSCWFALFSLFYFFFRFMWAFKYHLMIPGTHLLGHCSSLVIPFNEDAYNEDANFFMPQIVEEL